jgi:hypothetical protein
VAKRRRGKQFYSYECSITGKKFKRTRKVENTDELMSVHAYYDLHPENDDRPDHIKAQILAAEEERAAMEALFEASAAEAAEGQAPESK